jgi:capsule polysaccharide export protein KpsE/RkpR
MTARENEPLTAVEPNEPDVFDVLLPAALHWPLLVLGPLVAGVLAFAATFVIAQTFTSRAVFLPPQQQQSTAASALAQLGALSGLAGISSLAGAKNPTEQYVALLQSATISDRMVDRFDLMKVYDVDYRFRAREELAKNVRFVVGKKDGLVSVEVEDELPQRASDMANQYVDELRRVTGELAITEAQQRRLFFESQLTQTRDRLTAAQQSLSSSGFSQGALRADARASAEGYARLRAEVTSAEVRLQTLRRNLADSTPEVQQAVTALGTLRSQLVRLEQTADLSGGPDYITKYREFKYQETLFDLFARQYELARVDESREGSLIQVVDAAMPAEWKTRPKRAVIAIVAALATLLLLFGFVQLRHWWREAAMDPERAAKVARIRAAFRRS